MPKLRKPDGTLVSVSKSGIEPLLARGYTHPDDEPVGNPGGGADTAAVEELRASVAALEQELVARTTRVAELEEQLSASQADTQAAEAKVAELEAAADGLSYGDLSKEALAVEVQQKGLEVERGDGKEGDPLKDDLVAALQAARASGDQGQ